MFGSFEIEIWNLFGICDLEFGNLILRYIGLSSYLTELEDKKEG